MITLWKENGTRNEEEDSWLKEAGYIRKQNEIINDFNMSNSILRCFVKGENHIQGAKELIAQIFENSMNL